MSALFADIDQKWQISADTDVWPIYQCNSKINCYIYLLDTHLFRLNWWSLECSIAFWNSKYFSSNKSNDWRPLIFFGCHILITVCPRCAKPQLNYCCRSETSTFSPHNLYCSLCLCPARCRWFPTMSSMGTCWFRSPVPRPESAGPSLIHRQIWDPRWRVLAVMDTT